MNGNSDDNPNMLSGNSVEWARRGIADVQGAEQKISESSYRGIPEGAAFDRGPEYGV